MLIFEHEELVKEFSLYNATEMLVFDRIGSFSHISNEMATGHILLCFKDKRRYSGHYFNLLNRTLKYHDYIRKT